MKRVEGIPYKVGEPLPIGPGSILYAINSDIFYEIKEQRIDGVAIYHDHCCAILDTEIFSIVEDCEINEIDDVFFATREAAVAWKEKNLNNPPYPIDDCNRWVSPEQYIPKCYGLNKFYVKLQTPNGVVKTYAYYDDGSEYPEDKGFWNETGRHSKKLTNIIAWIGCKEWDPEEQDSN